MESEKLENPSPVIEQHVTLMHALLQCDNLVRRGDSRLLVFI